MLLQVQLETGLIVGGFVIISLLVFFIIVFISLYQKRYYKYLREKEALQISFSQELLQTRLEIQEETFKTISQEIHDNIGQALSFVKLNLTTVDPNNALLVKEK